MVAVRDPIRVEAQVGHPPQQGFKHETPFEPGQLRSQTEVRPPGRRNSSTAKETSNGSFGSGTAIAL